MNDGTLSGSPLMDILLRHASTDEEARAIIKVLRHWSNLNPEEFPAQLAVVTLTQWHAAASIPVEVEQLLERYRELLQASCEIVDASIVSRLDEFASTQASFEESVANIGKHILHLNQIAVGGERRLKELIHAGETYHGEARQRLDDELFARTNRLFNRAIFAGCIYAVAFLILVLTWSRHFTSSEPSGQTANQGAVQPP